MKNYFLLLQENLSADILEFHIVSNMKPKTNVIPSRKPILKFNLNPASIKTDHIPLFLHGLILHIMNLDLDPDR